MMITLIKKSLFNLMLIAGFCALAIVITIPLRAELRFNTAEKLATTYKWKDAEAAFRSAVKIDPCNVKYLDGLGKFLVLQARYSDYKELLLKDAEKSFVKLLELNPRNAEIYLELGLLELSRRSFGEAFGCFRKAKENDPDGFNVAYAIGVVGLGAWKDIGDGDRSFVMDRLKHAIWARSAYADDIYTRVWNERKDFDLLRKITPETLDGQRGLFSFIVSHNLLQFRKEQADRLEYYLKNKAPDIFLDEETAKAKRLKEVKNRYNRQEEKRVVSEQDWHGNTPDGKFIYENGNMYWTGTIDAAIGVPQGGVTIKIRAKGQPADGVYPYMIVELDGEEIGESFVESPEWKDYEFKVNTTGGIKVISVTFVNDGGNAKEDRNLFIGSAEILKSGK